MTTPKIELKGVSKRFGSKVVLDGVDLELRRMNASPHHDHSGWVDDLAQAAYQGFLAAR